MKTFLQVNLISTKPFHITFSIFCCSSHWSEFVGVWVSTGCGCCVFLSTLHLSFVALGVVSLGQHDTALCLWPLYRLPDDFGSPLTTTGWPLRPSRSIGYPHWHALLHLQAKLCDWLTGGALWDANVLLQCGHSRGHEHLAEDHEPGHADAEPHQYDRQVWRRPHPVTAPEVALAIFVPQQYRNHQKLKSYRLL